MHFLELISLTFGGCLIICGLVLGICYGRACKRQHKIMKKLPKVCIFQTKDLGVNWDYYSCDRKSGGRIACEPELCPYLKRMR